MKILSATFFVVFIMMLYISEEALPNQYDSKSYLITVNLSQINSANTSLMMKADPEYRYERLLIDGIWWVFVYDEYDRFIESYIDPNQ